MVAIVDYGMGNISSVQKAFNKLGVDSIVTSKFDVIEKSDYIVLPGVGSFNKAMYNLREKNLVEVLDKEVLTNKKPFLGICLGMQLLADKGIENGEESGLGYIGGKVIKIESDTLPVPHMGWNNITVRNTTYFAGNTDLNFYFVHSYHFVAENEHNIAATVEYGCALTAAVQKDNIFGTQFHPEKSQNEGIELLKTFLSRC